MLSLSPCTSYIWQMKRSLIAITIVSICLCLLYHQHFTQPNPACREKQRVQLRERLHEKRLELEKLRLDLRQLEQEATSVQQRMKDVVQLTKPQRTLSIEHQNLSSESNTLPELFLVTATKWRWTQRADITRLAQTLMQVPRLRWVVVEDADTPSVVLRTLLESFDVRFTHMAAATPPEQTLNGKSKAKLRGVAQRNAGLVWVRTKVGDTVGGVAPIVYFADDDNTYDLRIFEEMRRITRVGIWPVGLSGGYAVERPIVDAGGKVVDFIAWNTKRKFPVDMAGFAINYRLILKYNPQFTYKMKPGFLESDFLKQITTRRELEPLADNCTKVWVWHTQTVQPRLHNEMALRKKGNRSNEGIDV